MSEIEFCTLYVVAERWILDCILRFMHAKNHFSDTLVSCRRIPPSLTSWPHAVHGRIQHLALTKEGHSTLAHCKQRVLPIEKELMSGLSEEKERTIRRWLVRIAVENGV